MQHPLSRACGTRDTLNFPPRPRESFPSRWSSFVDTPSLHRVGDDDRVEAPTALSRDIGYLRLLVRSMRAYLWAGFGR